MSYLVAVVLALSLAVPAITAAPDVLSVSAGAAVPTVSAVQEAGTVYLGPDGEPLPFENDEAIVDFLSNAGILEKTKVGVGINEITKLLMERDGVRAHAAFRDVDITETDRRIGEIFFLFFRDSYIFDCAAYEMSLLLGMDNVPPTVLRPVDGTPGSVQLWVEGASRTDTADFRPPSIQPWIRQMWTMFLFDALIYNVDRNPGNLMVDGDYKLWLIDHGRGFQRKQDPFNIEQVPMVDRSIWERLRVLDEATITAALDEYLDSAEIAALMARHGRLVDYISARIEELGADKVLF